MNQIANPKSRRTASARGRPREFDTNAVLESASQIFRSHGYHATSIEDLCNATGLLRGSLYGVFGDKHGIMLAALDHYAEGAVARVAETLNAPIAPEEALRNALLYSARVSSTLVSQRGCFVTNTTLEMQPDDAEIGKRVASFQRRLTTLLAASVIRGQASGAFRSTLDEKAASQFLLCVMQGLRVISRVPRDESEITGIVEVVMSALG